MDAMNESLTESENDNNSHVSKDDYMTEIEDDVGVGVVTDAHISTVIDAQIPTVIELDQSSLHSLALVCTESEIVTTVVEIDKEIPISISSLASSSTFGVKERAHKVGYLASNDKISAGKGAGEGAGARLSRRRADAAASYISGIKNRLVVIELFAAAKTHAMSPLLLTQLILYQEARANNKTAPFETIHDGTLPYLLDLDILNAAFGSPEGSPLALSLRARQMTCSECYTKESTTRNIPLGLNFPDGITYAERAAAIFSSHHYTDKNFVEGIIRRAIIGVEFIAGAVGKERDDMISSIEYYAELFAGSRTDMRILKFGIDGDLDPTMTPKNIGSAARALLAKYATLTYVAQTTLTDENGVRLLFNGVFWGGCESLAEGTCVGYYEGRIITQCDFTEKCRVAKPLYVLNMTKYRIIVDAENIMESNWTRYINDGAHERSTSLVNVMFDHFGAIYTTKVIQKGEEFFLSYGGNTYWET